jgi:hypothetical protein
MAEEKSDRGVKRPRDPMVCTINPSVVGDVEMDLHHPHGPPLSPRLMGPSQLLTSSIVDAEHSVVPTSIIGTVTERVHPLVAGIVAMYRSRAHAQLQV